MKTLAKSSFRNVLEAHAQPPDGIGFYASLEDICSDPTLTAYSHLLSRAWRDFDLDGVVCVAGIPTLYLCCSSKPVTPEEAAAYHRRFWNQGVATIFVLADPNTVSLYSALATPAAPGQSKKDGKYLIETVSLADYAIRIRDFYFQLATGRYYLERPDNFDPKQSVDAYLLDNLGAIRDAITTGVHALSYPQAHAFLARVLFTCYLIDRGIINLVHYEYCVCAPGAKLVDVLEPLGTVISKEILYRLFDDLKGKFNGSMFENSTAAEKKCVRDRHIELLIRFLRGHKVGKRQLSLGFWAYDFQWIPVETISAIYEDFLVKEDWKNKKRTGAFYTPRFLAETALDVAMEGDDAWESKRFLDPACGSGIFLVALFNRLAGRWLAKHPECTYEEKATALLGILRDQLYGSDISPTACRIACFSLYLAFLDRFDPPDIAEYVERTGRKLPRILLSDEETIPEPDFPVIVKEDFLNPSGNLPGPFGYVVGNPPWQGRGTKQIAQHFALRIPEYLEPKGRACILLPSKVLFNRTSNPFQVQWLSAVTLEKVVQLADYRFILFKNASCPSIIARFTAASPDVAVHGVDYETPKVRRIDLREGIIPVAPTDRKRIPLRELLYAADEKKAPILWKQHLWGTPRDTAFLGHLFEMPNLKDCVDILDDLRKSKMPRTKRWVTGQGFKPYKYGKVPEDRSLVPLDWSGDELLTTPYELGEKLFPQRLECTSLSKHLSEGGYYSDKLYSKPPEELFMPPLVLVNQGFTVCSFLNYPIRFRDSLQSIAGPPEDEDLLLFLTFYLRSKLARYFLFHTAANWGTERDKVHLDELLRLPFPLPGSEDASSDAEEIVCMVVQKARRLKAEIDKIYLDRSSSGSFQLSGDSRKSLSIHCQKLVADLQAEVEPLFYRYFDLIDQEIILIEDTVDIFIKSATPHRLNASIPTLEPIHKNSLPIYRDGLAAYAGTLADTLNGWAAQAESPLRVSISGGVYDPEGLAFVTLEQTSRSCPYKREDLSAGLGEALSQLQKGAIRHAGRIDYLRGIIWFEEKRIRIVKPFTVEFWTRTAALNDAAEIYARIAKARQATERS